MEISLGKFVPRREDEEEGVGEDGEDIEINFIRTRANTGFAVNNAGKYRTFPRISICGETRVEDSRWMDFLRAKS